MRIFLICTWEALLAAGALVTALSAWPAVAAAGDVPATVRWVGPDFVATGTSAIMFLGVAGAVAGSAVHTIALLSARVGLQTFESTYTTWYVLRPFAAAMLALLFVATVNAGIVTISNPDGATATVAYVCGGLSGLCTDAVVQRLRALLGATPVTQKTAGPAVSVMPRS